MNNIWGTAFFWGCRKKKHRDAGRITLFQNISLAHLIQEQVLIFFFLLSVMNDYILNDKW